MQTVHRLPGIVTTDHEFSVPLDYTQQTGEQLRVFVRAVVAVGKQDADLPWLLFLQGGPGFPLRRYVCRTSVLRTHRPDHPGHKTMGHK